MLLNELKLGREIESVFYNSKLQLQATSANT